jgi:hypothetical protein
MPFMSLLILIVISILAQSIYNVKKSEVDGFISGLFNKVEGVKNV